MTNDRPIPIGVVLAGGASRRMGSDKASLWLDGELLVVRVARRVASACARVVIASGDGQRLGSLPWTQIADAVDDVGPLGGVLAALELAGSDHDLVAVVAVDLPHADPDVLATLGSELRRRGAAVVAPRHRGRIQPLHAVWRAAARGALRRYLDGGGRSVHGAFDELEGVAVDVDHLDPAGRFTLNLNRPEDLAALGGSVSGQPRPDPPGQGV
ncbi:MAG: molybdenum cofactor guanylyltransferase [Actinobacteria bacterium]|nr:molybdenum cofactor guanylyltransferase [Actinomycetota bacterium]